VSKMSSLAYSSASAHLAEITHNKTYLDAVVLAATFTRDHLMAPSGLLLESIDARSCFLDSTSTTLSNGIGIHAWSVLADVSKDTQWQDL
jgi:hypothetical protein